MALAFLKTLAECLGLWPAVSLTSAQIQFGLQSFAVKILYDFVF